jgi:predicted dehydrogenase
MGRRFAETVARLPGARLAAVADARAEVAEPVARATGAALLPDAQALAAAAGVEAVFVCTPEDAHEEAALAALQHGKHLFVEKPVTADLAGARRIRDAAASAGTVATVGHLLRFEPRWAAAQRLIAAGEIGEVVSMASRRVGNVRDQDVLKGRTSIPLYYGVHDLDIVRWFAGAEAVSIQAARRSGVLRATGYDIDDLYCGIVRFPGDVLATVELGWHLPATALSAPSSGITVVGTRGWLRIEQGRTGLEVFSGDEARAGSLAVDTSFWPEVHGRTSGALVNEVEHFLDCIRDGRPALVSIDDGMEALRLSLAMEAAADSGTLVELAAFG